MTIWKEFFKLVHIFIKLLLFLPVTTTIIKIIFYVMDIIKSKLQNRKGDRRINGSLVVYIEKDIFDEINNEVIIKRF